MTICAITSARLTLARSKGATISDFCRVRQTGQHVAHSTGSSVFRADRFGESQDAYDVAIAPRAHWSGAARYWLLSFLSIIVALVLVASSDSDFS